MKPIVFILLLALFTTCMAFQLTEPKWPYKGINPYDLPNNSPEMSHLLRLAVGSPSMGVQLKQWMYTFTTVSNVDITQNFIFYPIGFDFSLDLGYLTLPGRGEAFIAIQTYMNETVAEHYHNITQLPMFVQPYVFAYNIPGFNQYVSSRINESVVMDVELLADIYMGVVTNWNDSRIRELNPTFVFPNSTIIPMGYKNKQPSTIYITQAFWEFSSRFRKAFPNGPFSFWPVGDPNVNPNLALYNSVFAPVVAINDFPSTIGYVDLPIFNSGSGELNPYVIIKKGDVIYIPNNETSVMNVYKNVTLGKYNILQGIDYKADGYPFSGVIYVLFCEGTKSVAILCPKDRGTLKFFNWVLSNDEPKNQGSFNGFYYLPSRIIKSVKKQIFKMECYNDGTLLQEQIIDDHESFFDAILIVCLILGFIIISVALFLTFYNNNRNKDKEKDKKKDIVSILYTILLAFGATITLIGLVFFYIVPDHNVICQLRIWLTGLGFTIFFGSIFTRTIQMFLAIKVMRSKEIKKEKRGKRIKRSIIQLTLGVIIVGILQVILLICWSTIDPFNSTLTVIDDVDLTSSWVCKSDNTWIWIGIEIGYFACLFIYGLTVCLISWDKDNQHNLSDGKWTLIMIYNVVIVGAAILPVVAIIEIKDKQLFYIANIGVTFVICSSLIIFCFPKTELVIAHFFSKIRRRLPFYPDSTSTSTTTRSKTASNVNTNSGTSSKDSA